MDKGGRHLAIRLLRLLPRFITGSHGSAVVILALSLPVLLGLIGLAIDVVKMEQMRAKLQALSDAAAVAAARELSLPNTKLSQIKSVVASSLAAHTGTGREPVSNTVDVDTKAQQVRVGLAQNWVPFFAQFLDASVTPIKVQSTARLLSAKTKICVLALDPDSPQAIHLEQDAVIMANDCGIQSNSSDGQSIRLDDRSRIKANIICAAGGIKTFKVGTIEPEPLTDCPPVPDPLALRAPPDDGGCDFNNVVIKNAAPPISGGVYCGGLTIKGNAEVTLNEGVYIIKNGPLQIDNGAVVNGKNVGFYLTGSKAVIDCAGDASVSLSGRKTGPMAGLLFFEDRSAQLNRQHKISCANAHELTGTIYLPRGILHIDPNSPVAEKSAYTAIVANRLELNFGPDLVLNADYDATDVPVPEGIKSAGTIILTQ